ncbi:MAG: hypothetical protein F6K55_24080 [Moorea sp. SIO4A3]|nr:hypothetical protein [Moorena sp. SIO4A3]
MNPSRGKVFTPFTSLSAFIGRPTTLYLTAQGTEVVAQGKRRMVDPHWRTRQQLSKNWLVMGLELL